MAMTLLQLSTETIEGIDTFNAPTTIVGNEDPTAVLLKNVATQVGRELIREVRWQVLQTAYSFPTVPAVANYALPADIQRPSSLTFWNETERRQLIGPENAISWAALTRGMWSSVINYSIRVSGGFLKLNPVPSSVQTIGYDYYSKYYCTTSLGVPIENWAADSDLWRLDPDLAVLGMRYRFRARKGLPFAEEKADYVAAVAALQYDDTPKPLIDTSGLPRMGRWDGIPDGFFG